ncbi:hypothetical protein P5V15_012730 [Pogonomyrmex californicus]
MGSVGDDRILLAGDLNAWDKCSNMRGKLLFDWTCGLGLNLVNSPGVRTCCRVQGESTVDLAWCTGNLMNLISEWKVLDDFNGSDHKFIVMEISDENKSIPRSLEYFPS